MRKLKMLKNYQTVYLRGEIVLENEIKAEELVRFGYAEPIGKIKPALPTFKGKYKTK